MVAISFEILDDFQADYQKGRAQTYLPNKSVLNAFGASTAQSTTLFGEIEEIPKCLNCGKPLSPARPNKKYCNAICRDEHFHKREAAAKLAVLASREQEALAWAKDNTMAIQFIAGLAIGDKPQIFGKLGFREYWERARKTFREVTFDNNHSSFVSRYIMDTYPELAGAFRTRN